MSKNYYLIVEQGFDGYLIADVVGLPGCRTQAKTYEKLIERSKEAISLYKEATDEFVPLKFLGLQQVEA